MSSEQRVRVLAYIEQHLAEAVTQEEIWYWEAQCDWWHTVPQTMEAQCDRQPTAYNYNGICMY